MTTTLAFRPMKVFNANTEKLHQMLMEMSKTDPLIRQCADAREFSRQTGVGDGSDEKMILRIAVIQSMRVLELLEQIRLLRATKLAKKQDAELEEFINAIDGEPRAAATSDAPMSVALNQIREDHFRSRCSGWG